MEDFEVTQMDGGTGLSLAGELDLVSAPQLIDAFAAFRRNGQIRVDLSGLTFIDSGGLHALASIAASANGDGPLLLEGASARIMRLFEITGLTQHPNIEIK